MKRYGRIFFIVCLFFAVTGPWVWSVEPVKRVGFFTGKTTFYERTVRLVGSEPEKIVAAQVSLFYCQNLEDLEGRIKALAAAGFNTLIIRVFQNRGDRPYQFAIPQYRSGVYFKTQYAPVVDDVLGPLVRLSHRYGLRVFAWMTTRYANYGFEDAQGLRPFFYDFREKTLREAKGFNLFRQDVVTRLEGLYADLARYPIDGILFQDDLILRHHEGFSAEARNLFFQDHGYMPDPALLYGEISTGDGGKIVVSSYTDRFWTWARWKNQKMLNLAEKLMGAARKVKPGLLFAINFYYESVLEPENAMAWYSQSLEAARDFPFDYFSIMAYHRQMQDELSLTTMQQTLNLFADLTAKAVEMVGDPARVLMKVQVVDWKDSRALPQEETEKVLRIVGAIPGIHVAIVSYQPDLPLDKMIRSLTPPRVHAKQKLDLVGSIVTHEPRPSSCPG